MKPNWTDIFQITLFSGPGAKPLIRQMLDELFLTWPHFLASLAISLCVFYSACLGDTRFAVEALTISIAHVVYRAVVHQIYCRSIRVGTETFWMRVFFASAIVSGVAWGTSLALLIISAPEEARYLTLTVACVIVQSATARAFMAPLPLILQTLVLAILVVSPSVWNGDWIIVPAAILFIAFQAGHMRHLIAMRFRESQSQAEKDDLLRQLAKANDDLSQANEALRQAALTDSLTGLANRRAFDLHLELHCTPGLVEQAPISLIFFDVDHFKLFNDTFGHQAGDACLQIIGQSARETISKTEQLAARYGGEEFALVLPKTGSKEAQSIAERLRHHISTIAIPVNTQTTTITISLGVATLQTPSRDGPAQLLARADLALYRAKQSGRNRVEVVGSQTAVEEPGYTPTFSKT